MPETESKDDNKVWKKFLRKHWEMVVLFVAGAILALVGAVIVYLWFVGHAQSIGLVPATLDLWSMASVVTFLLHLVFWEVLLIGIPVIIAAVAGWMWWRRLPAEERKEYSIRRQAETSGGEGGISLLIFIAFCIKVFLDERWNDAFANWTLDYLVYSCLSALIWVLIIFGIPIAIGIIWWLRHEMKKKP